MGGEGARNGLRRRMVEEEEGENFDYSRCDCYCVAGRDEEGTGGRREERQPG